SPHCFSRKRCRVVASGRSLSWPVTSEQLRRRMTTARIERWGIMAALLIGLSVVRVADRFAPGSGAQGLPGLGSNPVRDKANRAVGHEQVHAAGVVAPGRLEAERRIGLAPGGGAERDERHAVIPGRVGWLIVVVAGTADLARRP